MLSDYLYCGLVAGGAMLGIGLIARALPSGSDANLSMRSLAVLMAAFAEGLGILSVVIGLSAVFLATTDVGGTWAALAVLVPVVILGGIGLRMSLPGERTGVQSITLLLLAFAGGLGILAVVVAIAAALLAEGAGAKELDPLGVALGIVGAAAAISVGAIGGRGVGQMAGLRAGSGLEEAAAMRSRTILPAAIAEGIGVLSMVGMFYLVFVLD